MDKSIATVVVTFNRLNLLKECIEAIRNQSRRPEAIIVVNNGSTDGTELWLQSQNDLTVYNQGNVGGAGGFNRGIREAYEAGFDWIWAMDDDGYPALNFLKELIAAMDKKPEINVWGGIILDRADHSKLAFDCPAVITEGGEINWEVEYIPDWAPFFNGIMFSRETIKKVGYPNPLLFIWGDEVDFMERTRKQDVLMSSTKAVYYHPKDRLYSTLYRNLYVYDGAVNWKAYCFFRNRAYLARKHYNRTETGSLLNQFSYFYKKMPLGEFLKALLLLSKAHFDGLTCNLKRKLPY